MERRGFLKGLAGLALSLGPVGSIIKKLAITPPTTLASAEISEIAYPIKISKPFIITIDNPTSAEIFDVDVLGAFKYLGSDHWKNDNTLCVETVEISSKDDVSHRQFLMQTMLNPIPFERFFIKSENAKQFREPIIFSIMDVYGCKMENTINPFWYRTPYDTDSTIIEVRTPFVVDGFTSLIYRKILPNTKIEMTLYPAIKKTEFGRAIIQN